jgi:murein L,D-transpeptidase YafK
MGFRHQVVSYERAWGHAGLTRLMKLTIILPFAVLFLGSAATPRQVSSFRELQLQFSRVRTAAKEKDDTLRRMFEEKKLAYPPRAILFRAFKKEAQLELWASEAPGATFTLIHTYAICATSGVLGPKRKFGDVQVPEGFYELDWFNPQSNFYLSLHISYPNSADRILGSRANPGGDIFLHGNCVTIGCIPITDDGIKEVYWLAVQVHGAGQRHIPIEIFPARLTEEGFGSLKRSHPNQPELLAFWGNLREGFDLFEKAHRSLKVTVASDGRYKFGEDGGGSEPR